MSVSLANQGAPSQQKPNHTGPACVIQAPHLPIKLVHLSGTDSNHGDKEEGASKADIKTQ